MTVRKWTPVLGAAALLVSASASAPAWAVTPVHERQQKQDIRIEQGIRSGELTPEEADHLQQEQDSIRQDEADMRAQHGGRLTSIDRERLQRRLNRFSAEIKELKNNDARGPGSGPGGG